MADKTSTMNKIFVGVAISVITAVVVAALGLDGGGGTTTLNINGGTSSSSASQPATICVTNAGSCPLAFGGQRGGQCYCQTVYGNAYGVAQ